MTVLAPQQIASAAYAAGFRGDGLVWAVAVAEAESGGDTTARNRNTDGSVDRGLWQFNSRWHPEVTDAMADDPGQAAKAAYRVSAGGRSWGQWSTYGNGAAARQLGAAKLAAAAVGDGSGGGSTVTPADWSLPGVGDLGSGIDGLATIGKSVAGVASGIAAAAVWIANPHNWIRILEVVAGGAAVLGGLYLLSQTGAGPIADAGGAVVKRVGQAASAARQTVAATK